MRRAAFTFVVVLILAVSVVGAQTTTLDDFEDGDIIVEADGWNGWEACPSGGNFEMVAASDANRINGIYSGKINVSAENPTEVGCIDNNDSAVADSERQPTSISASVRPVNEFDAGGPNSVYDVRLYESDNSEWARLEFKQDNQIYVNGTALQSWTAGNVYDIEFQSINYDENSYELVINDNEYGPFDSTEAFGNTTTIQFSLVTSVAEDCGGAVCNYYFDDIVFSGDFSVGLEGDLSLDTKTFLEHGESTDYTVREGTTDVTDEANVTSADPGVVLVDESSNQLVATSDTSVNTEVKITAEYEGQTVSKNVTVANKSLDNIAILPGSTWPSAVFGSPGDETGSSSTWPGAIQLQWIFVSLGIGAVVSHSTRNSFIALTGTLGILVMGWSLGWVSNGVLMAAIVFVTWIVTIRGLGTIDPNIGAK